MGLTVNQPATYADFKAVVVGIPRKFLVFSFADTIGNWTVKAVSFELDVLVSYNQNGAPATFATDFPQAVVLTTASISPTFTLD